MKFRKILPILILTMLLLSGCAAPAADSSAEASAADPTSMPSTTPTTAPITIADEYKSDHIALQLKGRLRNSEDRTWQEDSLVVHPGEEVELQLGYANYSDTTQTTYVGFALPTEVVYEAETFTLYSTELEEPIRFKGNIGSVGIGDYPAVPEGAEPGTPGGYAYCRILATISEDAKPGTKLLPQVMLTCNGADDSIAIDVADFTLKVEEIMD